MNTLKKSTLAVRDKLVRHIHSEKRRKKQPLLVFISGIDGSGKSTIAGEIAEGLRSIGESVTVLHMDDFHNPKSIRYTGCIDEPARYYYRSFNTVHLVDSVLKPIMEEGHLHTALQLIDLTTDGFDKRLQIDVTDESVVILEGVFLARPELSGFSDLFIQLHCPYHIAYSRALARDELLQLDSAAKYLTKYYPAQLRYERVVNPYLHADIIVETGNAVEVSDDGTARWKPQMLASDLPASQSPMLERSSYRDSFDAICFDFWNTLVPLRQSTKDETLHALARACETPTPEMARIWNSTRGARESKELCTFFQEFRELTSFSISEQELISFQTFRSTAHRREVMRGAPQAHFTLLMLRAAGYKLGLISNCTSDLPLTIKDAKLGGLFDAQTYSCELGALKPDAAMYEACLRKLKVSAKRTLFVGDGLDDELLGAQRCGMSVLHLGGFTEQSAFTSVSSLEALLRLVI